MARCRDGAMSCCWLWFFCAYPSFLVTGNWAAGHGGIPLRIAADREKGRASWRQVGLPAQSLPHRRFRRALRAFICTFCMRVRIYVYVCMCADIYMYIYMCMCVCICICMRLYTCVCVCVCIFVHRLWVSVSVLQRVDGVMHAHVCSCTFVCVCIWVWVCIYLHFFAVSVACTLEQVFWTLVHGQVRTLHRCVFTPTYTSANTLAAGCANMCIVLHLCICMHIYMDAYVCL